MEAGILRVGQVEMFGGRSTHDEKTTLFSFEPEVAFIALLLLGWEISFKSHGTISGHEGYLCVGWEAVSPKGKKFGLRHFLVSSALDRKVLEKPSVLADAVKVFSIEIGETCLNEEVSFEPKSPGFTGRKDERNQDK